MDNWLKNTLTFCTVLSSKPDECSAKRGTSLNGHPGTCKYLAGKSSVGSNCVCVATDKRKCANYLDNRSCRWYNRCSCTGRNATHGAILVDVQSVGSAASFDSIAGTHHIAFRISVGCRAAYRLNDIIAVAFRSILDTSVRISCSEASSSTQFHCHCPIDFHVNL